MSIVNDLNGYWMACVIGCEDATSFEREEIPFTVAHYSGTRPFIFYGIVKEGVIQISQGLGAVVSETTQALQVVSDQDRERVLGVEESSGKALNVAPRLRRIIGHVLTPLESFDLVARDTVAR